MNESCIPALRKVLLILGLIAVAGPLTACASTHPVYVTDRWQRDRARIHF
jgi:hypothetical protein